MFDTLNTKFEKIVQSNKSGIINQMDTEKIGWSLIELGCGYNKGKDYIDYTAGIEFFVKPILHTLWNLGFKVGYATRSPNECIKYRKKKLDVCTSILESRFIIGEKKNL